MVYKEVAIIAIIAILQYCNIAIRFIQQGEYIINDFILYIIYIYIYIIIEYLRNTIIFPYCNIAILQYCNVAIT